MSVVCCPLCHGDLKQSEFELTCSNCGAWFPRTDGIPRLTPDDAQIGARRDQQGRRDD